ncbi:hypothetical protein F5B19DRAFT_478856 [Rostrohypoxylon terebratum]|nr:hypothetical protein F5B19DRAFT_478856 [Rostrohypoxylon terebratum]
MSPSREQLLKVTNLTLEALNDVTPESLVRYLSPTARWLLKPDTLGIPPRSKAEQSKFIGTLQPIMPAFRIFPVQGQEPIIDVVARKATIYLKSHCETKAGLYQNEYVWIFTFNEDGTEIDEVIEFVDSLYLNEWLPKLKQAAEEAAKK